MSGKITAMDVARHAGVSSATVDRVLNNRGGVSKKKTLLVLEAAKELGLDRALDMRSARTLRVGVYLQPPSNAFHASLSDAFARANQGPNPYNVEAQIFHVTPGVSAAEMIRRDVDRYDALVVSLPNDDKIYAAVEAYAKTGRPVVTLVSDIPFPEATYVGLDNFAAGRLAGDLVGRLLGPQGGDVLIIVGMMAMTDQYERQLAFGEVLSERFPNCHIIETCESVESVTKPGVIIEQALNEHANLKAVYNASTGVTSVARVLEKHARAHDIVYVSHEMTEHRRVYLKSGAIDALIDQNPKREVQTAIDVIAAAYGRLNTAPETTEIPLRIFMRENC